MEAQVFRALFCFFVYTDSFPDMTKEDGEDVMAQHLLVAADRYSMERLKLMCEEKLCQYIDVGSVATILALAEQHHCHGLKKACFCFLSSPERLKIEGRLWRVKALSISAQAAPLSQRS
ncbi:BTB/POZ and MATH domain-containing protein 1-like [Panicum virgatum]|uniref:BTB/POZ and MATH domain-containing protein 1-like n=1 Tax=Panicum virgatum TaxID=38727 RepID=UPI0019D5404B|nr:BTB/POZ and MATH domain-containing protein 1-like [Panicum virgatum]